MNYARNNNKTEKNISEILETVDLIKGSLKCLKQYNK